MIPFFQLEIYRQAEDDPRWKIRIICRNIIMVSAGLIVPIGVIMIITALILGDVNFPTLMPDIIMICAILHLFLASFSVLGALYIHNFGRYWLAAMIALSPQLINFIIFSTEIIIWLLID